MCGDIPPSILAVQIFIIDGNPWTSLLNLEIGVYNFRVFLVP